MPIYNLLEYSKNYRKTTGSLWNYYRDEPNRDTEGNIYYSIKISESFDHKTNITGKLQENNVQKDDIEIVVSLKYISNFWKALSIPLINCEISLTLAWSENCVLTSKATREADPDADPAVIAINSPTNAVFKITNYELYVLVVSLGTENENKLLEQLKEGFLINIEWNKYRSQISNQKASNNINYLIDPSFSDVNRLFVLSFENEEDRSSFSKYYTSSVEIKDYHILIHQKPFFEIPIKSKEQTYEQIVELIRNGDYTTGNLLDYEYFSTHYK